MPSTSRNMLVGISSTIAMIGPSFSVATEKRSSVSRAPVRSSELTSTRQRSHRKAWKIRPTSEPVQVGGGPFAADELDEELLERALAQRTGADLVDAPLRDEAPVGDPFERLVQEEQPRRGQQRRRQRELLAHAVRVVGNQGRGGGGQVHQRQQIGGPRLEGFRRHAVHLRDEAQGLRRGQPIEQGEIFRHHADAALDLDRLRERIEAQDAHLTARRPQQAGETLDRGGLACTVWSQESVEAAGRHVQVDAVDRALRSERARQPAGLDGEFHHSAIVCQHEGMNRLARERSPYLLQHAGNPVDWYPWGEEAFEKARTENKPIFLSIGYAACHWCHVMEHESFEDRPVADVLNADFVSIKVDREERPDVDRVYMSFVQSTTGSGGWPMTVMLTPALKPFFGGTYFPPQSKWGRPGFLDLLNEISRVWKYDRARVDFAAAELFDRLKAVTGADGRAQAESAVAPVDALTDAVE